VGGKSMEPIVGGVGGKRAGMRAEKGGERNPGVPVFRGMNS
jgi:hypothetical protein